MADLKGINLAMQTPFDENGAINYSIFEDLIEKYVAAGVHGLVLGAGTGQHPYLTEAECNRLYEVGAKRIAGRCNVICQTSALNMDEVIRRSRHAESVGADALMVLPPYLEGPSDEQGIFDFYKAIDAELGVDLVGYNIPQATGISVSPQLFERLSQLKNFNYIKDSAGDFTVHQEYLQTSGTVLNGCDTTTLYALMAGARGVIWGGANYMPSEAVELYRLVDRKEYEQALTLWRRMLPSLLFIWRSPYTPSVLRAAQLRGYGTGNVRSPLRKLSADQEAELRRSLEPLGV
ncbi:dihydrodipicolinate synthase family protein [Mesorhizobium sp.]|uniref:dihydrodipicolinate synthase family protein n=1 Tax=Mesorhizobium sp. TaxID=1871066 RepID=UPI000FE3BC36|nr:dihydrodipicolinate synthase family protein [Mesorhizobium sp.]RWB00290.1 MAG: dihydrodipicolinate synthase family protein [Mesorhizobium sp.]RWB92771.1 MAG: dihydrodipicolinate synthase family protein [Mesorhizobium sp.]RWO21846.1 MAG: dihydrodipicolinate synthase family protein [Mesorhizobium sp.]RWO98439.1 MAG: dihydrodipicolinate synthase family protein [Mesorhizobium sp.]RWP21448.1 MAG: dihydrodipicolinate synthase family protein [Mesorhizobium sp.]